MAEIMCVCVYLRWKSDWGETICGRIWRWAAHRCQACMNVTIKFVIQVEIALVLQRCSACSAFETVNMEVFILDSHKHTTKEMSFASCFVYAFYCDTRKNGMFFFAWKKKSFKVRKAHNSEQVWIWDYYMCIFFEQNAIFFPSQVLVQLCIYAIFGYILSNHFSWFFFHFASKAKLSLIIKFQKSFLATAAARKKSSFSLLYR